MSRPASTTSAPVNYDPELGRFLTRDPLEASALEPQSFNRYPYAGNNPVNRVDPKGLLSEGGGWEEWLFETLIFQECASFYSQLPF